MFRRKKKEVFIVSPKGKCFLNYLIKKKNGSNDYIEAYQDSIVELMQIAGCSEEEAVDAFLLVLQNATLIDEEELI